MIISREFIPFKILKQIGDPAYQIFRNSYASEMGEKRADEIMKDFLIRNEALCNREMGWCVPDICTVLRKIYELDYDQPLNTKELPAFAIPDRAKAPSFEADGSIVFFFTVDEEYGCFSQWYPSPFTVEGIQYATAEQYMMAKKALLFHDYKIFDQILKERDPSKCKKLGKKVSGFKGQLWDQCKEEIVFNGNLAKFSQNYDLQNTLLSTGDVILAEANPGDPIWGIARSADDPKAKYQEFWKGENLLGEILMRVRYELRIKNQMLDVADAGVHGGMETDFGNYYVSVNQKKEMDKLLKMVTGATGWADGSIFK